MDIGLDVHTTSLLRRPSHLTSSPCTSRSSASAASSPQCSVFSYDHRSSQRSITASSISSLGDSGQGEEDVAYYSDSDSQGATTDLSAPAGQGEHLNHGNLPRPASHDTYGENNPSPRTLLQTEDIAQWTQPLGRSRPVAINSPLPLNCRQNPRRTQRPLNGTDLPRPRPPPQLVRQCERKDSFVDSLVDTTTQTIETIWPLSMAHGRSNTDHNLIGLRIFVQEVLKRSKTSYSTLLVAVYYLIVVMSGLPKDDFTMEQKVDSDGFRAMQCGRRMFLAALVLASKYLQDRNYSTRAWSKISGLKVSEINTNERVFLAAVNWKLHMPEALFQRWERIVLRYSPSGHTPAVPRSSPAACQTWRIIVRQLNVDLDQFDNRGMLISDNDSAYYSESSAPSSRGSSPHAPRNSLATLMPDNSISIPPSVLEVPPLTLEPTPQESKSDHRMLPPLQPREGPLPTPQITPHLRNFCTPAVSADGLLSRRPSMSIAMTEHRKRSEELLLDCANAWQPRTDSIPQRYVNHVPSSLSNYSSSPETIPDVSRFPSRSSSISSVESSNCALPQPCLAMGAMRCCADMKSLVSTDHHQPSHQEIVAGSTVLPGPPISPRSHASDLFFKERPNILGAKLDANSNISPRASSMEDDETTPKPNSTGTDAVPSPSCQTYQAAAALVDLTLNRNTVPRSSRTPTAVDSRKRGRPLSMDFGIQSAVRDLVCPRSMKEAKSDDNDSAILIPEDEIVADTWLLKGGNGSSYNKNDELWATFDRQQESENRWDNHATAGQSMSSRSVNTSSDSLPRKKTCVPLRSYESEQNHETLSGGQPQQVKPGLCERRGGGSSKLVKNGRKTKTRSSRKPAAEMDHMLRNAKADYAAMQDPALRDGRLLYGEVRSW